MTSSRPGSNSKIPHFTSELFESISLKIKVEFTHTIHVSCDKKNFAFFCKTTASNIHDSRMFDIVYENMVIKFPNVETVMVDITYKISWICKKVQEDIPTIYK